MEVKNITYTVEWSGKTIWDDYFSDRKTFDDKDEALAFLYNDLADDPRVDRAYYTATQTIYFK